MKRITFKGRTPCPFKFPKGKTRYVASINCQECRYFDGMVYKKTQIKCKHPWVRYVYRSSVTGKYVTKEFAAEHPRETQQHTIKM